MIKPFQIFFDLTGNQTNELYNSLTEDGKKQIAFVDFQELIYILEDERRNKEARTVELNVTRNQFDFVKENVKLLSSFTSLEELKTFFRENAEEEWEDSLLENLNTVIKDFFQSGDDFEEFLHYFNIVEKDKNEFGRKSSLNIENQTSRSVDNVKGILAAAVKKADRVKNNQPSKGVLELFKLFLLLSDQIEIELNCFKEVNDHYQEYMKRQDRNIEELGELVTVHRASESKLAAENVLLKNDIGWLIRKIRCSDENCQ